MPNSSRLRIKYFARDRGWRTVGEPEWRELAMAFPDSTAALRNQALAECEIAVTQPFRGPDLSSLDALAQSLCELSECYQLDGTQRAECRATVIAAKDRARFASRNRKAEPAKRQRKEEMVNWMLVWLDDPGMFPAWVELRKRQLES